MRGVALLHSFFYEEARRVFNLAAETDPKCAMAYWGVAMTYYHPIWAPPTPDDLKAGVAAVEKAESIKNVTARERDYIAAIAAFYRAAKETASGPVGMSCHGPTDHATRRGSFTTAMGQLHDKYPDDVEAATRRLLAKACERDLNFATAESCTGGMIASLLTDVPGVAHAFDRGFVTYSEASKTEMLGVPAELIAEKGAVSAEVALAMAEGALARSAAHIALAVTGFGFVTRVRGQDCREPLRRGPSAVRTAR